MDDRTQRVLEYDKIIAQLADCAACSLGRDRIARLQPEIRPQTIRQHLTETTQAASAIVRFGSPPFGGLTDITLPLKQAAAQGTLAGTDLLAVAEVIYCAARLATYFDSAREQAPDLAALTDRFSDCEGLRAEIERCLDEEGQVRRHASQSLAHLYSRYGVLENRGRERLDGILRNAAGRELLRDPIIVLRDGRFCLPVRAEKQSQLRGVVHDRSDSGATVFIEPFELVEIGNELRQVEADIATEIQTILRELSGQVTASAAELRRDLDNLALLDFICARGKLSQRMEGVEPILREDGVTALKSARHPLLGGTVVPCDFWIGDDFKTLIITGPNTGGKTVTLKTVGLLTLMAQSGLHIPAEPGSQVAVFEQVWADIGDEQSLEQSLSTFSSHLTQIIKIISRAEAWRQRQEAGEVGEISCLVLLDELGAGTDPTEGVALGQALLEELHATGCRTVVTTHYNDLKVFAYATPGMENASVEFDVKTLQPTYRLMIGLPGSSNAIDIARRLGLPRRVTQRARECLSGDRIRVEDALAEMRQSSKQLDTERKRATKTQKDLETLQKQYTRHLHELESKQAEALESGFDQALQIVRHAEEEAKRIIAELQRQPRQSKVTEEKRREVAQLREQIEREARRQTAPAPPTSTEPSMPPSDDTAYVIGQKIRVRSLGQEGRVVERLRDGRYSIEVGRMRVEAGPDDLEPLGEVISEEAQRLAAKMHMRKAADFSPEIDLRGTTVEEAIQELEKYLDDARLAGATEVRLVHGKGTGALRQGLQKYLRKHPVVGSIAIASFGEGGDGVTVVQLK